MALNTFGGGSGGVSVLAPPSGVITFPSEFDDALSLSPSWDGSQVTFTTNPYDVIDWELTEGSPNDYYVNYAVGDNANAGTSTGAGNSWKTLDYAVANATSPAIVHLEDDYIGYLSSGAADRDFTGKLKLKGEGDFNGSGKTLIVAMRESYSKAGFSWSASGGNGAYISTSIQAKQYRSQFFLDTTDSDGVPTPMTDAGSIAACQAVGGAGTFFWDGDDLYVHMPDGTEPDPFVNWIYTESPYDFQVRQGGATASDIILLENLDFCSNNGTASTTGVMRYRPVTTGTAGLAQLGVKNCAAYGGGGMGFQVYDADVCVMQDCVAKYNHVDGFNYHSFVTADPDGQFITIYEHGCVSEYSGYDGWDDQDTLSTSCNGSTAHDSMHIGRFNCTHSNSNGAVIADVNGVCSVNYNVTASTPTGTADPKTCFWHEKFGGAGTAANEIMYLWSCYADDNDDADTFLTHISTQNGIGTPSSDNGDIRVKYWQGKADGFIWGALADWSGTGIINPVGT